jgi:glycosyltransferase involved in cell wall biosynthesis
MINKVLDRRSMIGLIERCDCFVSLHRSEGFGRGIAEAMLLGKPVIVTGYSGNMDFTNPLDGCIVDYQLVDVGAREYPHAAGQRWAEPDLEQAAWYMRRLVSDPAWGSALAHKGRALVEAQHGVEAVGRLCRARLERLGFV